MPAPRVTGNRPGRLHVASWEAGPVPPESVTESREIKFVARARAPRLVDERRVWNPERPFGALARTTVLARGSRYRGPTLPRQGAQTCPGVAPVRSAPVWVPRPRFRRPRAGGKV